MSPLISMRYAPNHAVLICRLQRARYSNAYPRHSEGGRFCRREILETTILSAFPRWRSKALILGHERRGWWCSPKASWLVRFRQTETGARRQVDPSVQDCSKGPRKIAPAADLCESRS